MKKRKRNIMSLLYDVLLRTIIVIILTWTKGGEFARAALKNVCTEDVCTSLLLHVLPAEQTAKVGAGGGGGFRSLDRPGAPDGSGEAVLFDVPLEPVVSVC